MTPTPKGLIEMAEIYTTSSLAVAIMGEEAVETNKKAATRTLRKFLRDELGEGKAVVGKGSRYALEMNKREVAAMKKKFAAWEIAQEEAKEARRIALEAIKKPAPAEAIITPTDEGGNEDINDEDEDLDGIEGPTDEEIAALLEDDDAEV
jgi:hypothetical protein